MPRPGQNIFANQVDAWVTATVAAAAITAQQGRDAVLTYVSTGIVDLTLGSPIGVTTTGANCKITVDQAAAVGVFVNIVHTSPTVKRITFTNASNAVVDPTRIAITVSKLS